MKRHLMKLLSEKSQMFINKNKKYEKKNQICMMGNLQVEIEIIKKIE
ncbi:MAG: hypothetical protein ACTSVI_10640 [Promethearchaeota archaeon]